METARETETKPASGVPVDQEIALVSPGRARYALGLLLVVYIFNFIDRQILAILLEDIKREIQLTDAQLGWLGGIAFALFYTFAGIPIARWADFGSRRLIIVLGLTTWSVMTAVTGRATSFMGLLAARVGVGIGEAAGSPPSHSLITDYFPLSQRARALSVYSLGIYIGGALGTLLGGWVGQYFGWRMAFLAVGLPGVALAVLVQLTLPEPRIEARKRGIAEPSSASVDSVGAETSPWSVIRYMLARPSFVHLSIAGALHAFVGYGVSLFNPAFFIRSHGFSTAELSSYLFGIGLTAAIGVFGGGWCVDRLGKRDIRWAMWIPALSTVVGAPLAATLYLLPNGYAALAVLVPTAILGAMYLGPTFAMTQSIAKPHMRALASAVLLFIINLIGLGLGPWALGALSDGLAPRFGTESLRYALVIVVIIGNIWSTLHYMLAARTLREDLARSGAASSTE